MTTTLETKFKDQKDEIINHLTDSEVGKNAIEKLVNENASILNLVELWKEEESRKNLIKLAELQKESVKDEVNRLSSIDEVKARILGLTEEEAING